MQILQLTHESDVVLGQSVYLFYLVPPMYLVRMLQFTVGDVTLRMPSVEAEAQYESRKGPIDLMLLVSALCICPYTVRSCTLSKSHTATCPFLSPLTTMLSCMHTQGRHRTSLSANSDISA